MASTFTLTAGESSLSLSDETVWQQTGPERRLDQQQYPAGGVVWIDLGDGVQEGKLSGWLHAASGAALQAAMAALDGWRETAFTLSIREGEGEPPTEPEDEWEDCVIWGPVRYGRRTPPQADGTVHVPYDITFRRALPLEVA